MLQTDSSPKLALKSSLNTDTSPRHTSVTIQPPIVVFTACGPAKRAIICLYTFGDYLELCDAYVHPGIWSQLCDGALDMVHCTMRHCWAAKQTPRCLQLGPPVALAAHPFSLMLVLRALLNLNSDPLYDSPIKSSSPR